jgi:hypothetical protein
MPDNSDDPANSEKHEKSDRSGSPTEEPEAKRRPSRIRRRKKEEVGDFRNVLQTVLAELVDTQEGGRVRKISRQQAYLNADLKNALKGDAKATIRLAKKAQKYGLFTQPEHKKDSFLLPSTGDDGKIIRMFIAEQEAIKVAEERGDVAMQESARINFARKR